MGTLCKIQDQVSALKYIKLVVNIESEHGELCRVFLIEYFNWKMTLFRIVVNMYNTVLKSEIKKSKTLVCFIGEQNQLV